MSRLFDQGKIIAGVPIGRAKDRHQSYGIGFAS